jgi:hypothetical protein
VIGDLHLAMLAHNTPEGDLAEYVMDLADEDPTAAGLSIVFDYDESAMADFALANGAEIKNGGLDWDGFQSPDPENLANLPHVRMMELRAADVVDEPAANEAGLFDRQTAPREADRFLAFAAGFSDENPGEFAGIAADRARAFLSRWLSSHGLHITKTEPPMATQTDVALEPNNDPPANEPTREDFAAELGRYTEAFGAENGSTWFSEGKSFEDSQALHSAELSKENEGLRSELAQEREKLESLSLGEDDPVDSAGTPSNRLQFKSLFATSNN